ncbi:hypothetical protein [Rhizobium sp. RCC_161_2]|uniref:hypothetical protein n=1 Tax=Rhizobium sp. RCC_161_2 TaxID=3239219 RepID=UPI0035232B97
MIWLDAAPERPVDATLMKNALAAVLRVDTSAIEVVNDLSQAQDKAVLCIIHEGDGSDFSQVVSIYVKEELTPPGLLEGGSQIANFAQTAILLPNDESANPYSFVLASPSGWLVNVLVDANQLDRHDRYVIAACEGAPRFAEGGNS